MRLDPTLVSLLARAGETLAAQAPRYDPGTRIALEHLAEQIIAFEFTDPEFTLYLTVVDGQPHLLTYTEQIPHCRLRGSLADIAALTLNRRSNLAGSGVEVFGSPHLLAQLQQLFDNLDIDWEEPLNELLGDVAGHTLAQNLRSGAHKILSSQRKLPNYLAEYLTEEARYLPTEQELADFYRAVDELRADADRLSARLEQLQQIAEQKSCP